MSIVRPDQATLGIPVRTALDPDLSTDALGVLVHLLACSQCNTASDLFMHGVAGRARALTAIEELTRRGYYQIGEETVHGDVLMYVRKAAQRGVFGPVVYVSRVYFVERGDLIKIGTTTRLPARLKELSKGGPVTLLASQVGGPALEEKLHRRFIQHHVGHEWFTPSTLLRSYIGDLQAEGGVQ